jgi:hypothetical protein
MYYNAFVDPFHRCLYDVFTMAVEATNNLLHNQVEWTIEIMTKINAETGRGKYE